MKAAEIYINPAHIAIAEYKSSPDYTKQGKGTIHSVAIRLGDMSIPQTLDFDTKEQAIEFISELKANVGFKTEVTYKGKAL